MRRKTEHARSTFKWKLVAIFTLLVVAVAVAVISWVKLSFRHYVKDAEMSRFRNSVIASLKIESKNYYLSKDDKSFNAAIAEVKRINPELSAVFISDEEGRIVGDGAVLSEKAVEELKANISDGWNSSINTYTSVEVEGEKHIVVSYKDEIDPYAIHFGFSTEIIKNRTTDLSQKVSFVVCLTTIITVLLGFAFIQVATMPIEKLAKDAERLSLGDMQVKLKRGKRSEIGRIYSSLARLKESILYSMKRFDMR